MSKKCCLCISSNQIRKTIIIQLDSDTECPNGPYWKAGKTILVTPQSQNSGSTVTEMIKAAYAFHYKQYQRCGCDKRKYIVTDIQYKGGPLQSSAIFDTGDEIIFYREMWTKQTYTIWCLIVPLLSCPCICCCYYNVCCDHGWNSLEQGMTLNQNNTNSQLLN
eukprot:198840_1